MVNFEMETNDIKIFTKEHMHKIILKGYVINNKYPNNIFKEKEIILFLESHREKYQLKIKYNINSSKIESVDMELEKVTTYEMSYTTPIYVDQFFCILDEKLEIKNFYELTEEQIKVFFNKKPDGDEELCAVSNNRLIIFDPLKGSDLFYIDNSNDTFVSNNTFIEYILSEEEAKEYNKNLFDYQIKNLGKF